MAVAQAWETVTIELAGEYDLSNEGELAAAFFPAHTARTAIVDLTNATYLDSCFLIALLRFSDKMALFQGQSDVRVVGASPHIVRIFCASGFDQYFDLYSTMLDALAADT